MSLYRRAILFSLIAGCVMAATGNREVSKNPQSPSAETRVKLAGQDVVIEYNAPSARGRKVEGGLIPYGTFYRMGADAATTITSGVDLIIGDLKVPKGVHTLFSQAEANGAWKLIVNKQTKQWGTDYDAKQDLGRTAMKVSKPAKPVEKFTLTLTSQDGKAGTLAMEWGGTRAEVAIRAQ